MILDTTFLIDLQREFRKGVDGPARKFLLHHSGIRFQISVISASEFLEGFDSLEEGEPLIRNLPWIPIDAAIGRKVAIYRRSLRLHQGIRLRQRQGPERLAAVLQ